MFQIGEFSKIARVSPRQLRHYEAFGLFAPEHIDPMTGYRYYSARQLPRLNRIIVLKELGLTLDQIGHLLEEDISPEEIHGMLTMKKAQMEQVVRDELSRILITCFFVPVNAPPSSELGCSPFKATSGVPVRDDIRISMEHLLIE